MKGLTIHQPFAELIARGQKLVENRTWHTHFRGELAIHAGLSADWLGKSPHVSRADAAELPRGVIVAVVRVVDCVKVEDLSGGLFPASPAMLEFAFGPWCWILDEVRRLDTPIAATGMQGLWNLSSDQVARLAH